MASLGAKRLPKELKKVVENRPPGVRDVGLVSDTNLFAWWFLIDGPVGGPYEGGKWRVIATAPESYPNTPPTFRFEGKIWHPGVDEKSGAVCQDLLNVEKGTWAASMTMGQAIEALLQMLDVSGGCGLQVNTEAAAQLANDRAQFNATAIEWTRKYGK